MAQQVINVGTLPNDGTGDPLRVAYQKTNSNFDELYASILPYTHITGADYTALTTDYTITVDPDGTARTVTLPAAADEGKVYVVKRVGTSNHQITVETDDPACTIDGDSNYVLNSAYHSVTVVLGTDGTDSVYYIIGSVG